MNTSTKTTIVISILGSLAGAGVLAAPAIASPPWAGYGAAGFRRQPRHPQWPARSWRRTCPGCARRSASRETSIQR